MSNILHNYIHSKNNYRIIKNYNPYKLQTGGSNILVCSNLEIMFTNNYERDIKKKLVYDEIFSTVFNNSSILNNLKKQHVKSLFSIIDKIYFNKSITKYIKKNNIKLEFKVSKKLTSTGGFCKKFSNSYYQIILSSKIINDIFNDNTNVLLINGNKCYNALECLISLFEHELVHLLIFLICPDMGKDRGGHTSTFKNIAKNVFGHTDYVHMLLYGDYDEYENKIKNIKENIKIGSIVKVKFKKVEPQLGYVIELYGKSVKILLKNSKIYKISYSHIENVSNSRDKDFEKLLSNINNKNIAIKEKLKKEQNIKIKFNGKIVNAKIISINKKSVSVELLDGKHWYIPYSYILSDDY